MNRGGLSVLSGPTWLAVCVGAFTCLVIGASANRIYQQAEESLLDAQQEQVRLTVQTSARLLDSRVKVAFNANPETGSSLEALQSIQRLNPQIDAVYVLIPAKAGMKVAQTAGKSPGIRPGVILNNVPAAKAVLEKGGTQIDFTSFEKGSSRSVRSFAALYQNGKASAVLGIDYKSIKFLNRTDSVGDTQRSGWLLAVLVGLLSCVAVYTVRFRQLREANELRAAKGELEESNHLLELRVEQRTEELKEALEAKSMFLTSAGHELRTPLNGLIGMTTLAIDENTTPELKEYLVHAKSSAQQLTQKVNQLLDLASLETGTLKIELEEMLVGEELDRALEKHRAEAANKQLTFSSNLDPALNHKFIVAKRRLIQIVDNLISNAIKFTEEGEVVLTASLRDRGNGVTWLDLLVEDSGCGMSGSDDTVFDLKTNNNLPSNKTGLGIALSISRRVTQLMGGVMEVIESNGQGTKMKVTVPLPRVSGESLV